jgi:Ca2+-transporting ATPase
MKTQNWLLYGAGILSLILTTLVIEIEPLANLFRFERLDFMHYGIALALAFSVIPIVEIVKAIQRAIEKKKNS